MDARAPTPSIALESYVARQAATVGRSAEAARLATTPPLGRFRDAAGPCLGIVDSFERAWAREGTGVVLFMNDSRSLIYARDDGEVRRIALPSGSLAYKTLLRERYGSGVGIMAAALSPDGRRIACVLKDGGIFLLDSETGRVTGEISADHAVWSMAWSPDSRRFVLAGQGDLRVVDVTSNDIVMSISMSPSYAKPFGVAWSPSGRQIASGDTSGAVCIWDAASGAALSRTVYHPNDINYLSWSPDGARIATASEDRTIAVGAPGEAPSMRLEGHEALVWCVLWSPDGRRIASSGGDQTIRIWDAASGVELVRHKFRETFAFRLAWAPDGTMLASAHPCLARLWDTRGTLRAVTRSPKALPQGPLTADLAPLPGALASLLRTRRSAPLSLLRDLLALTADQPPSPEARPLAHHPGMRALASLRWPTPARVSFLLLLLREHEDITFSPPDDAPAAELRWALLDALTGSACPPEAPPVPVAFLERALDQVDDRLLTLLAALGPDACADDPSLPLTLLSRLPELAPQTSADRRLLSVRVPTSTSGAAQARGPGLEPSGFASHGRILSLVPSQWALPDDVRRYRALAGGLLYRARIGREPPRLRPLVLVLDVSPTCFGPVDAMLRAAAHALAAALLDADLPAYFLAAGGPNAVRVLERRADLFELYAARARAPVDIAKTLALAGGLRESLRPRGPLDPAIVILSHPAFGAEAMDVPAPPHLNGIFVQYPSHPAEPAWQRRCERAVCLHPRDVTGLEEALGQILA